MQIFNSQAEEREAIGQVQRKKWGQLCFRTDTFRKIFLHAHIAMGCNNYMQCVQKRRPAFTGLHTSAITIPRRPSITA